jgi:transcriptional regulator GlxA family with amidase domain
MNVGIFIFDDVEVLDLAGPFEVFSVASRVKARLEPGALPPFNVFTVGETTATTHARGGLAITPGFSFASHPEIDLLVIPGGVVSAQLQNENVIRWISATAARSQITGSVYTGACLLAKAGLLDGQRATTHWSDIDDMKTMFPTVIVEDHMRWVDLGGIITSAGISAGMDMSLHLVSRLHSETLARATARQMDYRWVDNATDVADHNP